MRYRIEFLPSAQKQLNDLPRKAQTAIVKAIDALASNPRPLKCRKLSARKEYWRIRCGAYRILYTIQDAIVLITVVRVSHRKDAYSHIK